MKRIFLLGAPDSDPAFADFNREVRALEGRYDDVEVIRIDDLAGRTESERQSEITRRIQTASGGQAFELFVGTHGSNDASGDVIGSYESFHTAIARANLPIRAVFYESCYGELAIRYADRLPEGTLVAASAGDRSFGYSGAMDDVVRNLGTGGVVDYMIATQIRSNPYLYSILNTFEAEREGERAGERITVRLDGGSSLNLHNEPRELVADEFAISGSGIRDIDSVLSTLTPRQLRAAIDRLEDQGYSQYSQYMQLQVMELTGRNSARTTGIAIPQNPLQGPYVVEFPNLAPAGTFISPSFSSSPSDDFPRTIEEQIMFMRGALTGQRSSGDGIVDSITVQYGQAVAIQALRDQGVFNWTEADASAEQPSSTTVSPSPTRKVTIILQ